MVMELEEDLSMEVNLKMKISNFPMNLSVSPWQMLDQAQMEVNSSSQLPTLTGSTEDMLCSEKSEKERMWSRQSKQLDLLQEDLQKKSRLEDAELLDCDLYRA